MDDYRSVLSNVRPNVPRSYPSLPGAGLSRDPVLVMNAGSVHLELPQAELLWPVRASYSMSFRPTRPAAISLP
jgi:hypothetical protein